MEIIIFDRLSAYDRSMRSFYRNDGAFKNNKSAVLKIACKPGGVFYRNSTQKMIGVADGGRIRCQCVLIKHTAYDALTVSFFEAERGACDAVGAMMAYAQNVGKRLGCKRLEVSLDGHCNYAVGFLQGEPETPPLFGESYNPGYYHDFFASGYKKVMFKSFWDSLENIGADLDRLAPDIAARFGNIRLECADFRHFRQTMARYTDLSNAIFTGHRYCFSRSHGEDLELFAPMKPLLKPCNLIFASMDGADIGFILWYPDFNELVPAGKGAGIGALVSYKLLNRRIGAIKIAEIGVLPEHRARGVILLLFQEALRQVRLHDRSVNSVVSSWILEENAQSVNLTTRFAKQIHKRFAAYEKEI